MSGFFNKIGPLTSQRDLNFQKAKDEAYSLLQETGEHHSVMGISTANFIFRVTNSVLVLTEEDRSPWHEVWSTYPEGQSMYEEAFAIVDVPSGDNGFEVIFKSESKDEALEKLEEMCSADGSYQLLKMFELKKEFLKTLTKFSNDKFKPISKSFYGID